MRNFRDLKVYNGARHLAKSVFVITKKLPSEEKFSLTSQIRRASVSIVSNVAEGSSRSSNKDFCHFIKIALGSAFELEAQLDLAYDFEYITEEENILIKGEITVIQKMLSGLIRSLE